MKRHEEWLEEAIRMATENVQEGGGPFAALVVQGDQVVGQGVNSTHLQADPTAHAELLAIREACMKLKTTDLSDCIVYASGEPCPMCMGAIYWAKPKAVYYACSKQEASQAVQFSDPLAGFYEEMTTTPEKRRVSIIKLDPENKLAPFYSWSNEVK